MANNAGEADKNSEMSEPMMEVGGQYLLGAVMGASNVGRSTENACCKEGDLMVAVIERTNMKRALERVERNKGAPGVDGMTTEELRLWLHQHWDMIKGKLMDGTYEPAPVRHVSIPKPDGGERMLGVPTVLDRLIQQAIAQVMTPIFDPHFSQSSFGYRPRKTAWQAVEQTRAHMCSEERRWVIDLDLEKFFDEVHHDILLRSVRKRVKDPLLLKLIGRYLRAGMMKDGLISQRQKGTPQGGPLSPLLSNILLDEFDKEIEKRGHKHVRYADDCMIYVKSKRSGECVLDSLTKWLKSRLRLKVNEKKSAVDRPWKRKFLGYSVMSRRLSQLRIAPESVKRFKSKVKQVMRKGRGRNLRRFIREDLNPILRGWISYFRKSETHQILDKLDGWIRRRLRNIVWCQWKRPRTRRKKLIALGIPEETASKSAYNGHGPWMNCGAQHMQFTLPNRYFLKLGLVNLQSERAFLKETALL